MSDCFLPYSHQDRESVADLIADLTFPTLRYRVAGASVTRLAKTGDADKYAVELVGSSGARIRKIAVISGCFLTVESRPVEKRKEMAYQIAKRAKDAARDIATIEGIDWKANEERWPTEAHDG